MMISAVISGAVLIVGALEMIYQIYHITVIDATARGLKHPKLWGFLAMNGNHTSGLLLYLIGRRNYPLIDPICDGQSEIECVEKSSRYRFNLPCHRGDWSSSVSCSFKYL